MIGFSNKPLRLALHFGTFVTLVAICLAVYYFFDYFINGTDVSGFTTLVISVWAIAGILISLLGILGLYIGKIYDQVKARPTFIIKDKININ
jgi:dolichol-phosphate mannosyltransferase